MTDRTPHSLEQVVDRMEEAGDGDRSVTVRRMLENLGRRSFGPLMLLPALVVVSPLGGILGLPTAMAGIIAVVAAQLLLGRRHVWLPNFVLRQRIRRSRLERVSAFVRPAIDVVDSAIHPRMTFLTEGPFARMMAATVIVLCCLVPPLELIPFANSATTAAIAVLALALIAGDGLTAVIGMVVTAIAVWIAVSALVG